MYNPPLLEKPRLPGFGMFGLPDQVSVSVVSPEARPTVSLPAGLTSASSSSSSPSSYITPMQQPEPLLPSAARYPPPLGLAPSFAPYPNRQQLPNLSSVLNKIQSEQRLPLPAPTLSSVVPMPQRPEYPPIPTASQISPGAYYPRPPSSAAFDPPHAKSADEATPEFSAESVPIMSPSARVASVSSNSSLSDTTSSRSTNPRKYKCKMCGKAFTTSGHLARHNRIHTGVKNHICPYEGCNARFSRQDNCMQHYKTHLNGKKSRKRVKRE
ncbi:DEKNAAC102268 [Brettanomyces naardenensis]|uniref:DEKNAAC102268 n=1 Tax=Brettanomyces naardenensis TaxID=13370 RepID=A0A448YKW0_BRENA|nr:DEKNAAC102268 [Brettanomyces naardenensis]